MAFRTQLHPLTDLLAKVGDGRIQLPDFQREYRWDEERIRALLVTVLLGHPLGSILLLESGNEQVRFKPKPLAGSPEPPQQEAKFLLLDGQQRLTSLYQSLTGDGVVDTVDARGKRIQRRFFVHIASALTGETPMDEAVQAFPEDGVKRENFNRDVVLDLSTPELQRYHGYLPLSLLLTEAGSDWLFDLGDRAMAKKFLGGIRGAALKYQIPAIELDQTTTKAAVATVFEKVNTGGLPLDVFELLTAVFAGDAAYYDAHGTDFRLADDWTATAAILGRHPVLAEFARSDFLQVVALLSTLHEDGATSAKRGSILRLALPRYLKWAPEVRKALVWVAQFLEQESIHGPKDVPYTTQLVPLTAIRVLLGQHADLHGIRARLRRWYWCGVLGELYGSAVESRFARDVEQVPSWARAAVSGADVTEPSTLEQATFSESRLLTLQRRNSAAYKGVHALIMATGSRDWMSDRVFDRATFWDLAVDIHHIFPQDWCKQHGYEPSTFDSIVNKTALAAATNRSIGGVAPSTYVHRIEAKAGIDAGQLDELIRGHLIDPDLLRTDDFEGFLVARRQALLGLIEAAMGKPAHHDLDEGGRVDEPPEAFDGFTGPAVPAPAGSARSPEQGDELPSTSR